MYKVQLNTPCRAPVRTGRASKTKRYLHTQIRDDEGLFKSRRVGSDLRKDYLIFYLIEG